jgi:hypothetical protein
VTIANLSKQASVRNGPKTDTALLAESGGKQTLALPPYKLWSGHPDG